MKTDGKQMKNGMRFEKEISTDNKIVSTIKGKLKNWKIKKAAEKVKKKFENKTKDHS